MNAHVLPPPADDAAPMRKGELIPRITVEQIVAYRNKALTQFAVAHAAIADADAALGLAWETARLAAPTQDNRFNYHAHQEKAEFIHRIKVPEKAGFLATACKLVDTDVWAHVIAATDLENLMDKKAKDQLNQQLLTDPPEATIENICATLEQFALDSATIWKRGIAECFSSLDRRFRSHDGWKLGGRIILTHAFDDSGRWSYNSNQRDTIIDIERIFRILEHNDPRAPVYAGAVGRVEADRRHSFHPQQSETHTDYFRVKGYKNGNAHLWFSNDELVERVNQILGEYYGAPIPEDREPEADTGLYDPKTLPAKRYGFFPTPDAAADHVVRFVPMPTDWESAAPLTILEPSAGTGQLARRCLNTKVNNYDREARTADGYPSRFIRNQVDCVEIQPDLAQSLSAEGVFRKVHCCNFLSLSPETTGLYDRVVMNPPFDRDRDIDHVIHALEFLKPDGALVAIMSAGTEFRQTKKAIAFRELMRSMNAVFGDLPDRSFSEVGTNCNTIALRVVNGGRDTGRGWSREDLWRRFEVEA